MANKMNDLDWARIDTVFLDMDGTLMDLAFDNYFWHEYVPLIYSKYHKIEFEEAKILLLAKYKSKRGSLNWYCTDYWSQQLDLNIAELKREIVDRVVLFPLVTEFLMWLRINNKRSVLLTNAHMDSVRIKMEKTGIENLFDRIISSHHYGHAKEADAFWPLLAQDETHCPENTLLIDDNIAVLQAADRHGIQYLLSVGQPDKSLPEQDTQHFVGINGFEEIVDKAELTGDN